MSNLGWCDSLVQTAIKNMPGGGNKQQEEIGSIIKHQEVSESFRRCQEAPGRHNIKIIMNKQTEYSDSEATSRL